MNNLSEMDIHQSHLKKIRELSGVCEIDTKHAQKVEELALDLFDQLNPLLMLKPFERKWLEYAALLHEIGWVQGHKDYHKVTLAMILSTPVLDFDNKERLIIGSIARYHRGALPDKKHDHLKVLSNEETKVVRYLSAILRLAFALDGNHLSAVQKIQVKTRTKKILIKCYVQEKQKVNKNKIQKQLAALENATGKAIKIMWVEVE